MNKIISVILFLSLSCVAAGASGVGFTHLVMDDPVGGKMRVSVWYPTKETGGIVRAGPFIFSATKDAPIKHGKFGLVIISHGTGGSDLGHRNIAVELARKGLVVAAPLHPRDNFKDSSGVGKQIVMEGRPLQLSASVTALLSHKKWKNYINEKQIGAFGFSLGGYTVLSLLGAAPEISNIIRYCKKTTEDPFCKVADVEDGKVDEERAKEFLVEYRNLTDDRFCVAALADPVAVPFSNEQLLNIKTRYVRVWRPESENVLLAKAHASRVVQQLNLRGIEEKTSEVVISGAQHYSFIAPFPSELISVLPKELTGDALGFDRSKFQKRFASDVSDYLLTSLQKCSG